jgi:ABC-type proline/glycine betaine transport system permease subunit
MQMLKPRHEVLIAMILTAALSRLVPHPPNFAPIGALALFGGAQFADKRAAFLVPLAAMLLSDLVIGLYSHMEWVYGSFALITCMGLWLRAHRTAWSIAGTSLTASTLFFLVTNLGVWANSTTTYAKGIAGLVACYCLVLFGGLALLEKQFAILREPAMPGLGAT